MVAFLIVLLRRVWHVQCFCRCEIRSTNGNSVWVENTDYSHTALKWAATTQQFRPFRQSCEAKQLSLLTSHGKSWHWRDDIGTQNWLIMATQCGMNAWFIESLGKNWNITNQRTKEKTYWWQLSFDAFSTHFPCPFDAVMWDELNEAGGVTYL